MGPLIPPSIDVAAILGKFYRNRVDFINYD